MDKVYVVFRDYGEDRDVVEIFTDEAEAARFADELNQHSLLPRLTVEEWPLAKKATDLYVYEAALTLPSNTCQVTGPWYLRKRGEYIPGGVIWSCPPPSEVKVLKSLGRSEEEAQANVLALRDKWEAAGRPCPEGTGYHQLDLEVGVVQGETNEVRH